MENINHSRRGVAPILVLIGVTILVAGGAVAWNYLTPQSPDKIVAQAVSNFFSARSFAYNADFSSGEENVSANGAIDYSSESPKFLGVFSVDISSTVGSLTGELESRFIDDILYLNLKSNSLPQEGILALVNLFANQWLKIEFSDLNKFNPETDTAEIENYLSANKAIRGIIGKHFKNGEIFRVEEEVGEEVLGDVTTTHYKVYIDKERLAKAAPEIYAEIVKASSDEAVKKEAQPEFLDKMRDDILSAEFPNLDLWVGRPDHLLYKLESEGLSIAFSNYNKPVAIDVPQGATNIEEILQTLFSTVPQ
ncbi:MAG: hypothetical protein HYS87_00545 [Candidatus Colwellbacteria bacterium]|nr:hypothetical protein [Candidatus Colwellbacteria bacterium]